jgi:hypothetical protein
MPQQEFANQKALLAYAERNALVYAWERSSAFARRQRLLSPEQYEIVEVRTSRGISRALLFSQAILMAEWEANAPLREAMARSHGADTAAKPQRRGQGIRDDWPAN